MHFRVTCNTACSCFVSELASRVTAGWAEISHLPSPLPHPKSGGWFHQSTMACEWDGSFGHRIKWGYSRVSEPPGEAESTSQSGHVGTVLWFVRLWTLSQPQRSLSSHHQSIPSVGLPARDPRRHPHLGPRGTERLDMGVRGRVLECHTHSVRE